MIVVPPYLQKGDKIGIVAPAGYMPVEKMQACIETLDAWGFTVEMGETTHSNSENYFAANDKERLKDLQHMLDDKHLKAILCARGGYGISRIIDDLNFRKFKKHPKWIVGFSDITVLLVHIFSRYKVASIHGPMANAFNDGYNSPYVHSLKSALEGFPGSYECAAHEFNQDGQAEGVLVGGNLSLLTHLMGTASELKTKDKILFLEDVGEYLYNIDRMMLQLKRSGKLQHLAGLIIGGFTDNKDTERPFGKTVYEIIHHHVKEYQYPICFGFPVSHDKKNFALKIGVPYKLRVLQEGVVLYE
jgi:muramoyltetrapeptide carboxypeptidase